MFQDQEGRVTDPVQSEKTTGNFQPLLIDRGVAE